jgi:MmyB-like transcription regulator ligand binding domain
MDRHWNVLMANRALPRIFARVRRRAPLHGNVLHQIFDPNDLRPAIVNWLEVASDLIRHLHQQVAAVPSDARARALLDEVLKYPDVPAEWRTRQLGIAPAPLLTTTLRSDEGELRFLSTWTTFGTTWNITIEELRIESMFPADEATAEMCRALVAE